MEWAGRAAEKGPLLLSASWARMEPSRGDYDGELLGRCRRALREARAGGAEPIVIAHSGALPDWQIARGGWLDPDALAAWGCFVERLAAHLGDQLAVWIALWSPLGEAACYDADSRRVARVLIEAQAVAWLHLSRARGHGGKPALVGLVEDWGEGIRARLHADALMRVLTTGRWGPPWSLVGELLNGTPATDFVGVSGRGVRHAARFGLPVLTIGAPEAEIRAAQGVRFVACAAHR